MRRWEKGVLVRTSERPPARAHRRAQAGANSLSDQTDGNDSDGEMDLCTYCWVAEADGCILRSNEGMAGGGGGRSDCREARQRAQQAGNRIGRRRSGEDGVTELDWG